MFIKENEKYDSFVAIVNGVRITDQIHYHNVINLLSALNQHEDKFDKEKVKGGIEQVTRDLYDLVKETEGVVSQFDLEDLYEEFMELLDDLPRLQKEAFLEEEDREDLEFIYDEEFEMDINDEFIGFWEYHLFLNLLYLMKN